MHSNLYSNNPLLDGQLRIAVQGVQPNRDDNAHRPGMQVHAAVKSALLKVESHHGPPEKTVRNGASI